MRDRSEIWCETSDISLDEIERRANLEVQKGNFPTLIFISPDLYAELTKSMYSKQRVTLGSQARLAPSVMAINVSAGSLNLQPVRRLRNFLLIARKEDFDQLVELGIDPMFWNDQEKLRVDKAFEDLIILEGDNEEV